ncbi:MAG: HEAT repeat domain-containing protein [Deltaproteobacteria bacterium]|jgi:TolB-like protein
MRLSVVVLLLSTACATTTSADVRRMQRAGDVDGLVTAWDEAARDSIRVSVLDALSDHAVDPRARSIVLSTAERHPSEPVRVAAVRGLTRIDGDDATRTLVAGLGDPWPSVRDLSRATLESKGEAPLPNLEEAAAAHSNHLVRASSLQLLVRAATKWPARRANVEKLLVDRVRTDDAPKVRVAAVRGLGVLAVKPAQTLLENVKRTDDDQLVRVAADKALKRLGATTIEERVVVAVLPIQNDANQDAELSRLGEQLRTYVAARLSGAKVCDVVDRDKLDRALEEMRKVGKAIYDGDAPNAPEIGNFKLANQLVFGAVQRQGGQFTIVLNRMDVATLALVPGASATATGYRADLEQLKVEVTERFLARF